MKRILSLSLIIVMLSASLPLDAFAAPAEGYAYAGTSPEMYMAEHEAVSTGSPRVEYDSDGDPIFEVHTLMVTPDHDLAKEVDGETRYYRYSPTTAVSACENHFDVWHTSGYQWRIGASGGIVDDQNLGTLGITGYLKENVDSLSFNAPIPSDVQLAINENRFIGLSVSASEKIDTDLIASSIRYSVPDPGDTGFPFTIVPKFNLRIGGSSLIRYDDFGGNHEIPLIDIICGFNLWAIYDQSGSELGQAKAIYSYGDGGTSAEEGAVQLAQVLDEGGRLKPGYRVRCVKNDAARVYDTDGLRIGSGEGIYASGGAIGYSFRYIFNIEWTYNELKEIPKSEYIFEKAFPLVKAGDTRTFRVSYLPGEGSGSMNDPNEYRPGELVTVLPNGFTAPKGKEFAYFSAFGGLLRVQPGETYNIPCDVTLTAAWKEIGSEEPPLPPDEPQGPADVFARLVLPPVSFEGHAVFAKDASEISVGDEYVNLTRAYAEGLAKNRFDAPGADTKERQSYTETRLIYEDAGTYDVTLEVETEEARSADTKSIEIKRTPSISAVLGGKQKENRKQTLDVTVAQNPDHPVSRLDIRISEPKSGESVTVSKSFAGPEAAPANSAHIKYRALESREIGLYYVSVRLEFLTKFSEERRFTYEIEAEDTRGNTDSVSSEFTVAPDEAPNAAVDLAAVYYREASSNIARVSVRDASTTDGDQLRREWQVAPAGDGNYGPVNGAAGFADESFGSLLAVRFSKTGVGPFGVKLKVTDVWTEETLPEYISASDYRSAETEASSHVDNIPPEVLLSLKKAKTAEILLLAKSRTGETLSETESNALKNALLKDSIAADIKRVRIADPARAYGPDTEVSVLTDDDLDVLRKKAAGDLFTFTAAVTGSSFWGDGGGNVRREDLLNAKSRYTYEVSPNTSMVTDGIYLFRVKGSLAFAEKEENLNYYERSWPFTLECWDLFAGKKPVRRWAASISESVFSSGDGLKKARLSVSEGGSYVFLSEEGRTLIIDKKTGAFITTIGMEAGETVFEGGGNIYTLKSDGIFRLSAAGVLSCIRGLAIHAGAEKAAMAGGRLHFVYEDGLTLYRGIFDPETESFTTGQLAGSAPAVPLAAYKGRCIGVDREGTCAVWYDDGTVKFWRRDGSLVSLTAADMQLKGDKSVVPVRDALGAIRGAAAAVSVHSNGSSNWDVYAHYYDLGTGTVSRRKESGGPMYLFPCGAIYPAEAFWEDGTAVVTYGPLYGNTLYNLYHPDTNVNYPAGSFIFDTSAGSAGFVSARHNQRFAARAGNLSLHRRGFLYETQCALRTLAFDEEAKKEQLGASLLTYGSDYTYMLDAGAGFSGAAAATELITGGETLASLDLKTTKASGSLSRTVTLDANRTYYYEYDTDASADILSFSRKVSRPSASLSPVYAVTEEYIEDFSKETVSGFFRADAAGLTAKNSNGCYELGTGKGDLSFTVPQGKTAALSFSYSFPLNGSDPAVSLEKDRRAFALWDLAACGEIRGRDAEGVWYYDGLLGPGSYTLKSGGRILIDDLCARMVTESAEALSGSRKLDKTSEISEDGKLRHVSGSFETGPSLLSIEKKTDAVTYKAAPEGEYTSVRRLSGSQGGYTERLIYTLPQGMKAVYIRANASQSAPAAAGSTYYTLDDIAYERFTDGSEDEYHDKIFRSSRGQTSFSFSARGSALYSAGSSQNSISSHVRSLSAEYASFDDIFMVFAPASGSSDLAAGRFMIRGEEVLVPGASAGKGVTLSFAPGKTGSTLISGLKLWYLEDGRRVYVTDTAFTNESYLAGWTASNASASVRRGAASQEEQKGRVYKKGQTVIYSFSYYDYEADPEKESFFRYIHEPLNDGLNPISGQILSAPVQRFYVDGKYTVEHWVTDRAGRDSGVEDYDYASNVASAVFYIEGSLPENEAPYVRTVRTLPGTLKQGDEYRLGVRIDDPDREALSVKLELYYESGSSPVYTNTVNNVSAGSGGYPEVFFDGVPEAREGGYEAVVTVSDGKASGLKSYLYTVKVRNSLSGAVTHTDEWENNRQTYNYNNFKDRGRTLFISDFAGYRAQELPRKRGTNVFWAGEALQLEAPIEGRAVRVTARLSGSSWSASLRSAGSETIGETVITTYTGELWDKAMIGGIAQNGPEQRTVTFTAVFEDGETLTYPVTVIFDDDDPYWMLHRAY